MIPKTKIIIAIALLFSFFLPAAAATEDKLGFGDSTRQMTGVLGGKKKGYKTPLDPDLYQTLFNLPDYTCRQVGYTDLAACYNYLIYDRPDQKEAIAPLLNWIRKKVKKSDDRARVAASMVQNIPYDYNKSTGDEIIPSGRNHGTRYPYETLYENAGICGEKASLIVLLLKELGYGTATLTFTSPALHQVAGVKCPAAYDFRDTGYCFIDPNIRHMITFGGSYETKNPYQVMILSDGKTLNAKNDWKDSRKYWEIINSIDNGTYTKKQAKAYKKLIKKYGM
ncbi:MAG: transglutaminase-like domain-containing protein [Parcubacteria group bacterium]